MSKRDYYDILGLAKTASDDDIKRAYRKLASKYHPDKYQDDNPAKIDAEAKFKEAKEAYETLSDPQKKASYDAHGHQADNFAHRGNYHDVDQEAFAEIFKTMFERGNFKFDEGVFGQRTAAKPTFSITISLADAYTGKNVRVDVNTTINIPRGVRAGTKLFANGKIYRIDIQPHERFKRSNDDLLVDVEISAIEAILGVEAVLEHLDGVKLQFAIPPGIQPGQVIRLGSKGMRNPEIDKIGDLMVRISVKIPRGLSDTEKASIKSVTHRTSINI